MTVICECAERRLHRAARDRGLQRTKRFARIRGATSSSPGHDIPQFEKVVDGGDGYEVVEKDDGPAAELAEETDPRS